MKIKLFLFSQEGKVKEKENSECLIVPYFNFRKSNRDTKENFKINR